MHNSTFIPATDLAGAIDDLDRVPAGYQHKAAVGEIAKSAAHYLQKAADAGDTRTVNSMSELIDKLEQKAAQGGFDPAAIRLQFGSSGSALEASASLQDAAVPQFYGKSIRKNNAAPGIEAVGQAEWKGLFDAANSRQSVRVATKAPSDLSGQLAPYQYPQVLAPVHEGRIMDYLPSAPTPQPVVSYLQHSSTTGNAAVVAPAAAKPEIEFVTTQKLATVSKIAGWTSTTTEALADFDAWRMYVPNELMRQLVDAENAQLLTGSGSGGNMTGLLNESGIISVAYAPTSGLPTLPDIVGQTIAQLRVGSALAVADLIVMHPTDFWNVRLSHSTLNTYLTQEDPNNVPSSTLWGINVVQTTSITQGTALVLDTTKFGRVWVREQLHLQTDPYSESTNNVVKFIAEERIALAVERPAAIAKITGLAA